MDTDVIVILIGQFEYNQNTALWVAFGTGKYFCYYCIKTICRNLGQEKSCCLSPFQSFTGCYHHHIFFCKTKKSAWHTLNAYPDVNSAFLHMVENPYNEVSLTSQFFPLLERFTILLYDKSGILNSINEARLDLFCKKNKSLSIQSFLST